MVQKKKSETDLALEILKERMEAMYYADLLREIARRMGKEADPETMTSIYTRLNLDHRLVHQGDGYWYFDPNRIRREG
ncbi:DNA-directed RNA polymerase subunit delta [Thermosyntropha lipolytica DSM 11003]|uniref:RNAP delta factor n=1 Tax=Thermosyntropha lipolytica DSM 11003 TaxID=1123382 RepID=A0A1M5Q0E9_9FIRM|nr:DNA-directed RNA polymerase subunit delta [Thermosyntropha lipolytica]SHH07271.1 DNA-directed RNA polymerase subunit delta [Thermosyntropha lipolytica DSM 11003]